MNSVVDYEKMCSEKCNGVYGKCSENGSKEYRKSVVKCKEKCSEQGSKVYRKKCSEDGSKV